MNAPLSEKLRPSAFDQIVGQEHLFSKNSWLSSSIEKQTPYSLLLYGPPGSGKTTFGRLYAKHFKKSFFFKSAVNSSVLEVRKLLEEQKKHPLFGSMILFLDEIHRYNRAQQDLFLPYIEDGSLILIGATTENPSFSINNALLSRLRLVPFNPLENSDLEKILDRYEESFKPLNLTKKARSTFTCLASGDARYFINLIELLNTSCANEPIDEDKLLDIIQKKVSRYDKSGDNHYQLISCLHKAVRGSDPNASIYWLSRMFEGGEDPLFICRRLIRMATEDIGLADPNALTYALNAYDSYQKLGSPEGELAICQAVIYLALAPKSNKTYIAFKKAQEVAKNTNHLQAPLHLINPVGKTSEKLGHGKGYLYDHDLPFAFSGQDFFPEGLEEKEFYKPNDRGFEKELIKRLNFFKKLKKTSSSSEPT